jgi:hypothetical protein
VNRGYFSSSSGLSDKQEREEIMYFSPDSTPGEEGKANLCV